MKGIYLFVLIIAFVLGIFPIAVSGISSEMYIPYATEKDFNLIAPDNERVFLTIEARIHFAIVSGSENLMRVKVNDIPLTGQQLVNKPLTYTYANGESSPYYFSEYKSWKLFYSPDFLSNNVAQNEYRVLEGNAYVYRFDVSDQVKRGQQNNITLQHVANEFMDIYTLNKQEIIRSTIIAVNTVKFEGEGSMLPQTIPPTTISSPFPTATRSVISASLIKSITPQTLRQNQTSLVTITIENIGTTSLYNIEIIDKTSPDFNFISGNLQSTFSSLKPGETRTIQYVIESKNFGKFILDPATARFADPGRNYYSIQSGSPMIEVLTPSSDKTVSQTPGFTIVSGLSGLLIIGLYLRKKTFP